MGNFSSAKEPGRRSPSVVVIKRGFHSSRVLIHVHHEENMEFQCRIGECVRAVTFHMKTAGMDVTWMEGSTIALARAACREGSSGREMNIAKEGRRRVPFTCDMYLWVRREYWVEGEWSRRLMWTHP